MKDTWRLIDKTDADVADIFAIPSAVAEGKIAGRYIMAAKATSETVIIQKVVKRGLLAGAEVVIDREAAKAQNIDVAVQPNTGRATTRPAETISLKEMMLASSDRFQTTSRDDDDLAALIYTSGTTGLPKGVMLSQGNFKAECEICTKAITIKPDDTFASLVPFFHVFGLSDGCILSIFCGSSAVLIPQYSPRKFITTLAKSSVSIILAIPMQYHHLMIAAKRKNKSVIPPIKYCISGAASLPQKIMDDFRDIFGATIVEGYGMTESTSAIALNPPQKTKPGSIGIPFPGVSMKIVDEHDQEVPEGEVGEICIQSKTISAGYYNLPADTEQTFRNGWLYSGDIGYKDTDGYYFLTDRKKDIIIKAGFNISPKEIEECLENHPKIKEAAVIGITSSDKKEKIKAFCVMKEGESVEALKIIQYCRKALAAYKTPDEIQFIDILPRSATGKVLRKDLKEDFLDLRLIEQER